MPPTPSFKGLQNLPPGLLSEEEEAYVQKKEESSKIPWPLSLLPGIGMNESPSPFDIANDPQGKIARFRLNTLAAIKYAEKFACSSIRNEIEQIKEQVENKTSRPEYLIEPMGELFYCHAALKFNMDTNCRPEWLMMQKAVFESGDEFTLAEKHAIQDLSMCLLQTKDKTYYEKWAGERKARLQLDAVKRKMVTGSEQIRTVDELWKVSYGTGYRWECGSGCYREFRVFGSSFRSLCSNKTLISNPTFVTMPKKSTSQKKGEQKELSGIGAEGYEWGMSEPRRDKAGFFKFADTPDFTPNLSPAEVLQMGSFGGGYFRDIYSSVTKQHYTQVWKELPEEWLKGLKIPTQVASSKYRNEVNKYKVNCGVKEGVEDTFGLSAWEAKGWIVKQDPYGWFQWYCRFFQGRRSEDDERQIDRWRKVCGKTGRWKQNLIAKCLASGKAYDDESVSPVVRQTLQHWGYALNEKDFQAGSKRVRTHGAAYVPREALAGVTKFKKVGIVQLRKSERSRLIPGVPVERGTDVFHKQVWSGLTVACLDQTCLCQILPVPLCSVSWEPAGSLPLELSRRQKAGSKFISIYNSIN
eukprot:g60504.t1